MQLDHMALQVLLLHELLGAGGALERQARPKGTSEASHTYGTLVTPRGEPKGRAKPEMPEAPRPGVRARPAGG